MNALLLSAGFGTRLSPYTNFLPKCLMPINGRPLLEIWLDMLDNTDINKVFINTHYKSQLINSFLQNIIYNKDITVLYEQELLGTGGTIKNNNNLFKNEDLLIAHSDNLIGANLNDFINYHKKISKNDEDIIITMMTFFSDNPENCGILKLGKDNKIVEFFEKKNTQNGNLANGAIYIVNKALLNWIETNHISDFILDVIIPFIAKIYIWHNNTYHIDIGTIDNLKIANNRSIIQVNSPSIVHESWIENYLKNEVFTLINGI